MACSDIQELHLLDLNDYCLLKVCEYLDVFDLIKLEKTCKRLQNLAKMAAINCKTFSLFKYRLYKEKDEIIKFSTILNLITPYIVSLDLLDSVQYVHYYKVTSNGRVVDPLYTDIGYNYVKLLDVEEFRQLKSINGLVALKDLKIGHIHKDISSDDLVQFLEKNSNIESLTVAFSSLNFPYKVLQKLRNLKKLYVAGPLKSTDWIQLLHIEQLSDLTIDSPAYYCEYDTLVAINVLTILATKKILTRIELRFIHFDDRWFNVLSLLNITKLRISRPSGVGAKAEFYSSLANTTLSNLTHLDIFQYIDDDDTFRLIKRFKQLEELKLWRAEKYNRKSFLEQIPHLFHLSTRSRPTLMLINYASTYENLDNVMIDFYNYSFTVNVKRSTG